MPTCSGASGNVTEQGVGFLWSSAFQHALHQHSCYDTLRERGTCQNTVGLGWVEWKDRQLSCPFGSKWGRGENSNCCLVLICSPRELLSSFFTITQRELCNTMATAWPLAAEEKNGLIFNLGLKQKKRGGRQIKSRQGRGQLREAVRSQLSQKLLKMAFCCTHRRTERDCMLQRCTRPIT